MLQIYNCLTPTFPGNPVSETYVPDAALSETLRILHKGGLPPVIGAHPRNLNGLILTDVNVVIMSPGQQIDKYRKSRGYKGVKIDDYPSEACLQNGEYLVLTVGDVTGDGKIIDPCYEFLTARKQDKPYWHAISFCKLVEPEKHSLKKLCSDHPELRSASTPVFSFLSYTNKFPALQSFILSGVRKRDATGQATLAPVYSIETGLTLKVSHIDVAKNGNIKPNDTLVLCRHVG